MAWTISWEGCIGLYKIKRSKTPEYNCRISVDNTNKDLIEKFRKLVGYGNVYNHRGQTGKNKACYKWELYSLFLLKKFLEEVLPYLPSKKEQARLVLEFCNLRLSASRVGINLREGTTRTEREEEIYQRMRKLNQRGMCEVGSMYCKDYIASKGKG